LVISGASDTTGAVRGVEAIATGVKWKRLREPLAIVGELNSAARGECWELGAMAAASLVPG